jgi:gas vesicle protein
MADDRGASLGWFLIGVVVGGLAALLITPKTGEENRERAGEWLDKSRELLEEQTQRLMGAFEAGRDAMREEIRRIPPRA